MTFTRRKLLLWASGAAASPMTLPQVWAGSVPERDVKILAGFPQGGPVDIAARLISPWLSERFGTPFVVENRPGNSGNLATGEVATAPADGYTLLLCGPVNVINTTLFPNLPFDFLRDLAPVAGISRVPLVVEVHPSVPAKTIPELLALARREPGRIRVAYAGKGTPQHVAIELFGLMAGVKLTLVPYLGSAPALADLLAGRVDAMFDPIPSSIGHIRKGSLVPLGLTGTARLKSLPELPLVSEFVAGYEAGSWFGLVAPNGTAPEIIGALNAAVNTGLADTRVQARLDELGAAAMPGSPEQFGAFLRREDERYAGVIRAAGITIA